MDLETARSLSDQTTDFYRRVSASFDATRQSPWPGWERVLELVGPQLPRPPRVLDLACGNLRFARFLSSQLGPIWLWAVDSCDDLVRPGIEALRRESPAGGIHYQHRDLAEALFSDDERAWRLEAAPCDLAVAFGFMHHVVLPEQRAMVLRGLVDAVVPGGFVVVSFWQFAHDERLRAKARPVDGGDAGDYLMGWQGRDDVARFCHSFEEAELDELVAGLGASVSEERRFSADGCGGTLNRYLVLRRVR